MEASAASAVAENRSDPMWLWLVAVLFIISGAHSRATELVIGRVPPLDGICLAEISHSGYWSCYKVSGHNHERNERTDGRMDHFCWTGRSRLSRDDIFSQRNMLLGCHCRRSCVLVSHENCRRPKIFLLLLLLLLRPPKLHDKWSNTSSIIQTVYLAVKK